MKIFGEKKSELRHVDRAIAKRVVTNPRIWCADSRMNFQAK